jgi:hypothetical protein
MMILLLPVSLICVQCFHPRGLPSSSTTRWFCCLIARFVHSVFIHEDSPHWAQHDDSVVAYQLDLCAVFSSTRTPFIQNNTMILLPNHPHVLPQEECHELSGRQWTDGETGGSPLGPGRIGPEGYAPWHKKVVGEIPVLVQSLEEGALEGVSPRVFPNLRGTHGTSPYVSNSLFILLPLLLSYSVEKKYFHGNVGTHNNRD